MPRPEKVQAVAEIKERLTEARAVFLAEYAGLSVKEQQELRRGLRATQGEFKVVKMTLARRAAEELGHDDLLELLTGPTGLTFADDDAAATAKALKEFSRDHAQLILKGALLAGEVLSPERVSELADLEPRDVLLARVAGTLRAPLVQMAGLLAALPRNLASMVQQLIDKLPEEQGGSADEPEPAPEPAAEDEAPSVEAEAVDAEPAGEEASDEAPSGEAPSGEAGSPVSDEEEETAEEAEDQAEEAEEE